MFIPSPLKHDKPIDWRGLVYEAVCSVGLKVTPAVDDALKELNAFAQTPSEHYSDPASGVKDAHEYCSLLIALDKRVSTWPEEIRELVTVPSACRRASTGEAAGLSVCRPQMEAVVVLYNAALSNISAGTSALARVSGESAAHASRTAGITAAPNVNAKTAFKHFQTALDFVLSAEQVTSGTSSAGLSSSERYALRSHLDLQTARELAEVLGAVAKYAYSLSSGSVGSKPDTLAKLAFTAATYSIPGAILSQTLRLLPVVMLAAYHWHKAEFYYNAKGKIPDMQFALGHIQYAAKLLKSMEGVRDEEPSSPTSWGTQLLRRMQSSTSWLHWRHNREKSSVSSVSDGESAGNAVDASFRALGEQLRCTDLALVYPQLLSLLQRVGELLNKYQYENEVVYLARVATEEQVRADVPDVEDGPVGRTSVSPVPAPLSFAEDARLAELCTGPEVAAALEAHASSFKPIQVLAESSTRLRQVVAQLQTVLLPREVEMAVEALAPCWEAGNGKLGDIVSTAQEIVLAAWDAYLDTESKLRVEKEQFFGAESPPRSATKALEQDVQRWLKRRERVSAEWGETIGTLSPASLEHLRDLLLPQRAGVKAFLEVAEDALHAASIINHSLKSGKEASTIAKEMEKLCCDGSAWYQTVSALYADAKYWDKRAAILQDMAAVVWEAPTLVQRIEGDTVEMEAEMKTIVMTPLERIPFSSVRFKKPPAQAVNRTAMGNSKKPRHETPPAGCASSSSSDGSNHSLEVADSPGTSCGTHPVAMVSSSLLSTIRKNRAKREMTAVKGRSARPAASNMEEAPKVSRKRSRK